MGSVRILLGRAHRRHAAVFGPEQRLNNVRFFDYQPKSELAHSLSAADLHLVPLTRELSQCLMPASSTESLPLGAYLTNAVPESELHQFDDRHQVGLTVPPGNPAEIANAVRQASRNRESLVTMGEMRGNWPNLVLC